MKSKKHYISITLKNNEQYVILHHEKCLTLTFMKVKNKLIHLNCQIKKKTFIYKNKNT